MDIDRSATEPGTGRRPTALELFAGVGGFHLALDRAGFDVIWSNQWEPSTKEQHAFDCYERHVDARDFLTHGRFKDLPDADELARSTEWVHKADGRDIATVLDEYQGEVAKRGRKALARVPDADLLVGGFPCQDYSVAKTLRQAHGIEGKKGVLWWEIHRLLRLKLETGRPIKYLFLENVDRLLKSPASQRGRDFGVMLSSLADLGYEVEWRVASAADYGFPQKRRRVFIIGRLGQSSDSPMDQLLSKGTLARTLPAAPRDPFEWTPEFLDSHPQNVSDSFGRGAKKSAFGNAGVMRRSSRGRPVAVWTTDVRSVSDEQPGALGDELEDALDVAPEFFVKSEDLPRWIDLKGKKSIQRVNRGGFTYTYDEGAIPFPDPTDRPSRTILTGEGGATPSRFKHIIMVEDGRYRRLTPRELEKLNGFPGDWTAGMLPGRRAFMMGNALVVGLIERVARGLVTEIQEAPADLVAQGQP